MSRANKYRGADGLSLVELLVAIAITVTLLGGIFALFFSVLQTVSRGYMVQQGFELGRGALSTIERDLNNAHTSRSTGENITFVGTPIGFSFVASLNDDPTSADSLSRVTYFVHKESTELIPMQFVDDPDTPGVDESDTVDTVPVITYSLIRYVEPGVSDLDSYRFVTDSGELSWVDAIDRQGPEPSPQEIPKWDNVAAELNAIIEPYIQPYHNTYAQYVDDLEDDTGFFNAEGNRVPIEIENLIEAKKRELYIRMLAGDAGLPRAFESDIDGDGDPEPGFLRDENGNGFAWQDYVVANKVAFVVQSEVDENLPLIDPTNPGGSALKFFVYGTGRNVVVDQAGLTVETVADPIPVNYFNRYWNTAYNVISPPGVEIAATNEATAQNLFNNNIALNLFFTTNNFSNTPIAALTGPQLVLLAQALDLGSPLDARLPELVGVTTPINLESTFIGVPDFQNEFNQLIKVPAAAQRKENDIITVDGTDIRLFPGF